MSSEASDGMPAGGRETPPAGSHDPQRRVGAPEPLILASASPRRAEILRILGIPFELQPAHVDERAEPGEDPASHVERLARAKATAVARLRFSRDVLGGDTIVTVDGEILGKPTSDAHAVEMLLMLRGRDHHVLSALALAAAGSPGCPTPPPDPSGTPVALHGPRPGAKVDTPVCSGIQRTRVRFRDFSLETARSYVGTGEPRGKAGAYAIQGLGSALVEEIEGDYSGVVGLPVPLLLRLLRASGRRYRFPGP